MLSSVSRLSNTHFASQAMLPAHQPIHFGVRPEIRAPKRPIKRLSFSLADLFQPIATFFQGLKRFFTTPLIAK
jgi:hypothetical protein